MIIPLNRYQLEAVNPSDCIRNRFVHQQNKLLKMCESCFFLSQDKNNCEYDSVEIETASGTTREKDQWNREYSIDWRQFVCIQCGNIVVSCDRSFFYVGQVYRFELECKNCKRKYIVIERSNKNKDLVKFATTKIE